MNLCETLDINGLLRLAEVHFSARGWRSFVYYFIGDVYCAYSTVSDSLAHALKARTTIASPHIRTPELVKTETVITWREIASPCVCVHACIRPLLSLSTHGQRQQGKLSSCEPAYTDPRQKAKYTATYHGETLVAHAFL